MFTSIKKLYRLDGMKGFYRGLTASYAGKSANVYRQDMTVCVDLS